MTSPIYADDRHTSSLTEPSLYQEAEGPMQERVQRLEEEIGSLRETFAQFGELMIKELKRLQPADQPPSQTDDTLEQAALLPLATSGVVQGSKTFFNQILKKAPAATSTQSSGWLLVDLFRDISATFRMYLDPRYRIRRSTQLFVPLVIGLFVLNYFFWSALFPIPVLDKLLEKVTDVVLAVLLYKVVYRELVRYREMIHSYGKDTIGVTRSYIVSESESPHSTMDIEK